MTTVAQLAMQNLDKKSIKKRLREGYQFMVIGVCADATVDRRYAKTLEEAEALQKLVSGQSYTVRLEWL